jgi:hypothetical protein
VKERLAADRGERDHHAGVEQSVALVGDAICGLVRLLRFRSIMSAR